MAAAAAAKMEVPPDHRVMVRHHWLVPHCMGVSYLAGAEAHCQYLPPAAGPCLGEASGGGRAGQVKEEEESKWSCREGGLLHLGAGSWRRLPQGAGPGQPKPPDLAEAVTGQGTCTHTCVACCNLDNFVHLEWPTYTVKLVTRL